MTPYGCTFNLKKAFQEKIYLYVIRVLFVDSNYYYYDYFKPIIYYTLKTTQF